MRPDDFAFAKGNAALMTAPPGPTERPGLAGLVLHGAGGIGKSTLASQIVSRVSHLEPERVTAVIRGGVSVDGVLGGVAAALRHRPAVAQGGSQAQSVRAADRADLPWAHRLALLRELVLAQVPVLLVLDDFDDNVSPDSGGDGPQSRPGRIDSELGQQIASRQAAHYLPPSIPPAPEQRAAAHIPPRRPAVPVRRFRAGEIAAFPTTAVYGPAYGPQLRLITCGGTFDRARRSYLSNVVVYAVAVASKRPGGDAERA
jgi:hypothetical protein